VHFHFTTFADAATHCGGDVIIQDDNVDGRQLCDFDFALDVKNYVGSIFNVLQKIIGTSIYTL